MKNYLFLGFLIGFAIIAFSACTKETPKDLLNSNKQQTQMLNQNKSDQGNDTLLIQPADLVELLKSEKNKWPLILQIGVQALFNKGHIPGAEYVGSASDPNGLQNLLNRLRELPKDKFIVFYCGCCPLKDCPNIKPAIQELKTQGFSNAKEVYLPKNFEIDWVAKGYPVESEK